MDYAETKKHASMMKVGVPSQSALHKMEIEKVSKGECQNFHRVFGLKATNHGGSKPSAKDDVTTAIEKVDDDVKSMKEALMNDPETKKHVMMEKFGAPLQSMLHKMEVENVSKANIQHFQRVCASTTSNDEKSKHPVEDDENTFAMKKGSDDVKTTKERLMNGSKTKKHAMMTKVSVPLPSALHEMEMENQLLSSSHAFWFWNHSLASLLSF